METPIDAAIRQLGYVYMISVYDDPPPLVITLPSIVPGRYVIPPVSGSKEEFRKATISRPDGRHLIRFATPRRKDGEPYVLLTVPPAMAFNYFAGQRQTRDEMGNPLRPDVARVGIPVAPEIVAEEIERQCLLRDIGPDVGYGVLRIKGEEPTAEELRRAIDMNLNRLRWVVAETSKAAMKNPHAAVVTPQARRAAALLLEKGLISSLPEWAISYERLTGRCPACNVVYAGNPVRCTSCGAIFDWKRAVEFGIVKEADVPAHIRAGWEQPAAVEQN